jgi:hypothetical protein
MLEAGYRGKRKNLHESAYGLLKDARIVDYIKQISAEAMAINSAGRLMVAAVSTEPPEYFRRIMGINETLGRVSFLARASLDDVLDDEGHFSIEKARETGAIHAIKRLRIRTHRRGDSEDTVIDVEMRDKNASAELMGKHLGLWDDSEDPRDALERLLGIPKSQLPAKADAIAHPITDKDKDGEEPVN